MSDRELTWLADNSAPDRAAPDATVLEGLVDAFRRFLVLPDAVYYDAVALWVLHAHTIVAAETTPRLVFKSPEKESGKTRALEVLDLLVPSPLSMFSATTAAIFRELKRERGTTILQDEVDAIFGSKAGNYEDLRALYNAGYRRGAMVVRCVGEGSKQRSERFPVFAAVALAAIGNLPDTIESRAILVPMRRRAPHETVEPFRRPRAQKELDPLRQSLELWTNLHTKDLLDAEPAMPDAISDRAADLWEPLLAIADVVGGEWPERARRAALTIVGGRIAEDQSVGVRLLADIRPIIDSAGRLSSAILCAALNDLDESEWGGWNGSKGITQRDLGRRLKPYGITPRSIRLADGTTPKGYTRDQFADAFGRYLRVTATSATTATRR